MPSGKGVDQMRRTKTNNDTTLFTIKSTRRSNGVSWNLLYSNHMTLVGISRRTLLRSMVERVSRIEKERIVIALSLEYGSIEGQKIKNT